MSGYDYDTILEALAVDKEDVEELLKNQYWFDDLCEALLMNQYIAEDYGKMIKEINSGNTLISFNWGYHVSDEDNSILEDLLNNYEIIKYCD